MPERVSKALQLLHLARFEESANLFQQALQSSDRKSMKMMARVDCMIHISIAYLELCRFEDCKKICLELIAEVPQNQQIYIYLAISLAYLKQFQKSLALCSQMLKLNNRNWRFYFTKAIVLKIMGRFEDASDCLALAIAKNSYNNPRAYILQAGCFAYLGEATNAMKNMHYAQSAVKQNEDKNVLTLYRYEINNVHQALRSYEKYMKKIQKADTDKLIKTQQKATLQMELIKIVSRLVQYCTTNLNGQSIQKGEQKQSQSQQINSLSQREQTYRNFNQDLQIFTNNFKLKTNRTISTNSSQNIENNNKIVCEWLRQKCNIF